MNDVKLNLISKDKLQKMALAEKIRMILDYVKAGNIVVLETGLTPEEEAKLIEQTMVEIDHENFTGIELETYPTKPKSLLEKLIGGSSKRLMVIGPANKLKTIKKSEDLISTLIKAGE